MGKYRLPGNNAKGGVRNKRTSHTMLFVFALLGSSRGLDRSVAESYASSIPDVAQIEPSKQHVFKYVAQGASSLL
tara:strand:+ start:115 stop:339 length:225 start_codon:yes stop_codon:yes gene_type:complete